MIPPLFIFLNPPLRGLYQDKTRTRKRVDFKEVKLLGREKYTNSQIPHLTPVKCEKCNLATVILQLKV